MPTSAEPADGSERRGRREVFPHSPGPFIRAVDEHERELADVDAWLHGSTEDAQSLVRIPPAEAFDAGSDK